jgi:hypothetical protein
MANTVPFNAAFGINVANNLVVNSTSLVTNGLSVNSLGINVISKTISSLNVASNNISGNTVTHLNLIANLVSQNVLTGNLATLKQLIANEAFVNSTSGNGATFVSVTANHVMVNTLSGNIGSFSGDLTLTDYSSDLALTFGNATNYTQVTANGIWFADASGFAKHVPAEVLLQKGTVTGTNNFFVNFSSEVNSNNFISMKLVIKYYLAGSPSANFEIDGYFSSDGTTATTSGYQSAVLFTDDTSSPYISGVSGDTSESDGNMIIAYHDNGASLNHSYHFEVFFPDTINRSANKAAFSRGFSVWNGSFGNARPMIGGAWHSSMNLKGFRVNVTNCTFSPCNWALVGIRA